MKIQQILSQYRRDFKAIYVCEHCGYTKEGIGYDDSHFHNNVIPEMRCKKCKKTAPKEAYRALTTKYSDDVTV